MVSIAMFLLLPGLLALHGMPPSTGLTLVILLALIGYIVYTTVPLAP